MPWPPSEPLLSYPLPQCLNQWSLLFGNFLSLSLSFLSSSLLQLDTLHLVQSPNILTVPSTSAHGELQLCIEVCTQSVKYFGHPSGTTSFRLCRCQLSVDVGARGREWWFLVDKDDASSPALGSMSCSPPLLVSLSLLLPSMFFFSHAHFSVF